MMRWLLWALVTAAVLLVGVKLWPKQPGAVASFNSVERVYDPTAHEELPPINVGTDDWPWWRGPKQDNVSTAADVPEQWSETENILWKATVPGRGHSSPVIWKNDIFLTTADEQKQDYILVSLDRPTGQARWQTVLHHGGFMPMHKKNSHASATPATDGERVFTVFAHGDGLWVSAVDLKGAILWQTKVGPFRPDHGFGASPAIWKSLVIVNGDNDAGSYIAALHRKTGAIVWRTARPNPSNYSTPIVAHVAGRAQLLLHGGDRVTSYDPASGTLVWSCAGPTQICANTVAFDSERVFASGGYPDKRLICVRANGSGDVSADHFLWESPKGPAYVPSPLVYGGHLYLVNDDGLANCFDPLTGAIAGKGRLDGTFSASLVASDHRFYISSEEGTTFVLSADPKMKILAANTLAEGGLATPVIVGGRIYLRTAGHLYCIAK